MDPVLGPKRTSSASARNVGSSHTSATGTLHANVTYSAQSPKLQSLFAQPAVEATFNIEKGVINNVDIVRAIQSPVRDGLRGGKTGFSTLAGSMRLSNQNYTYRQLQLSSGPMRA